MEEEVLTQKIQVEERTPWEVRQSHYDLTLLTQSDGLFGINFYPPSQKIPYGLKEKGKKELGTKITTAQITKEYIRPGS